MTKKDADNPLEEIQKQLRDLMNNKNVQVAFAPFMESMKASTPEDKEEKKDEKDDRVIRQERYYGKFVRSLRLGSDIDEGRIEAQYEDGVLQLSLPKTAEVKPRKVDIKVG